MMDDAKWEETGNLESTPPEPLAGQQITNAPGDSESFLNADGEFVLEENQATDEPEPKVENTEPIWSRLRRLVFDSSYRLDDPAFIGRLNQLGDAIDRAPDAAANYVLRGELYLRVGIYDLARDDFQWASELADAQFERSDWGLIAQAVRDRALVGLAKAQKKLLM